MTSYNTKHAISKDLVIIYNLNSKILLINYQL